MSGHSPLPGRPPRVLFWAPDTAARQPATGIQRVVRRLGAGLEGCGVQVIPVGPSRERTLRILPSSARHALSRFGGPICVDGADLPDRLRGEWLLVPETPVGSIADALDPIAMGQAYGMKVASLVHDLIPAKLPELYDAGTVALFASYFRSLGASDLVITTTRLVRDDLTAFLEHEGLRVPPMVICPLSGEVSGRPRADVPRRVTRADDDLRLITVGTLEPRKNHPRLLGAVRAARQLARVRVGLTIVGARGLHPAYDAQVAAAAAGMSDVDIHDHVSDGEMAAMLARHDASLYGSWEEGFGLPVLESLWVGIPCLCHHASAMAEVAPGGGCLMIDMLDRDAIAAGILRLRQDADRLAREAVERPMRRWRDTADDVRAALGL